MKQIIYKFYLFLILTFCMFLGLSCKNNARSLKINDLKCYYGVRTKKITKELIKIDFAAYQNEKVFVFMDKLPIAPVDTIYIEEPPGHLVEIGLKYNKEIYLILRLNNLKEPDTLGIWNYDHFKNRKILGFKILCCNENMFYPEETKKLFY